MNPRFCDLMTLIPYNAEIFLYRSLYFQFQINKNVIHKDVRFWRPKSIHALKELNTFKDR